ncbi:MAG: hypothetical protein QT11_C0001G0608 [archaeon GW2011_AR20]|nr:MAG: hypothetical protein QT11_C0001G0608 [archaeon GW2011_AR20]MBS3160879.1 hypothetical protein [Candidatus Woesearchaeota archaeon]
MEIVAKVSRGSKMDQIYLPKNRFGFAPGNNVLVRELTHEKQEKLFFYNIKKIEKIKIMIINEIFNLLNKYNFDNIIITGSFLEEGFNFNDVDMVLIKDKELRLNDVKDELKENLGINFHLILIDNKSLLKGISTDPLFQTMLSKHISKKRFIYNVKPEIRYRLLDMHLLKSNLLMEHFDVLKLNEKLDLLRNLISINLFIIKKQIISKEEVYDKIKELFGDNIIEDLKNNLVDKKKFIKKYKQIYNKTFNKILEGVRNESKQK